MAPSLHDWYDLCRAVFLWSRRSGQPLRWFLHYALQDRLTLEQTPRCEICGCTFLVTREGEFDTGVVAPDGGRERWRERWVECRRCGATEDADDFERRLKQ